jgi:hypothetical protein
MPFTGKLSLTPSRLIFAYRFPGIRRIEIPLTLISSLSFGLDSDQLDALLVNSMDGQRHKFVLSTGEETDNEWASTIQMLCEIDSDRESHRLVGMFPRTTDLPDRGGQFNTASAFFNSDRKTEPGT